MSRPLPKSKRTAVLERDDYTCQKCGEKVGLTTVDGQKRAQIHHRTPKSEGGSDEEENLVTLCSDCHESEHNHGTGRNTETEIDNKILDELHDGRNVPSNLAEELDVSRQYISQRLKLLEAADHVENVGRGVYQLVDDPRDDVEPTPDPADLQARIDELESDLTDAREDVEYYKDELRQCREQLEGVPDRRKIKRAIEDLEHALETGGTDVEVAIRRLSAAAGVE